MLMLMDLEVNLRMMSWTRCRPQWARPLSSFSSCGFRCLLFFGFSALAFLKATDDCRENKSKSLVSSDKTYLFSKLILFFNLALLCLKRDKIGCGVGKKKAVNVLAL